MIPKTSTYVRSFDEQTKWMMYFLIEDNDLMKNTIWDTVSADSKKEF